MNQPSLFTDSTSGLPDAGVEVVKPRARKSDPGTSHAAAELVEKTGTQSKHHRAILEALNRQDGLTSEEIAQAAGLDRVAAARRMKELEKAKKVFRGSPRKSVNSGRLGVTWWLTTPNPWGVPSRDGT